MINNLTAIWKQIEDGSSGNLPSSLRLRSLHKYGLKIGIDMVGGKKIIVLEIDDSENLIKNNLPIWSGMEIKPHKIEGIGNVLLFRLIDEQTHLFNFIIMEIYNCLEQISSKDESTPAIISLLDKIDSFFTKYQQGLNKSAQQGLYGELYFMFQYLFKEVEPLEALKFWRGHDRGTHDYVFPNGNAEIKTTSQKEHQKISINSEI